ncbi:MAG: hypothetical protein KF838_04825 [Phycisphaeraceae bacterium]|nr:MAG: hypothetical protein KF838_04825 [Phycisphaeraceae bacterium]
MEYMFDGGPLDGQSKHLMGMQPAPRVFAYRRDDESPVGQPLMFSVHVAWTGERRETALAVYQRDARERRYTYVPRLEHAYAKWARQDIDAVAMPYHRVLKLYPDAEYLPAHAHHTTRIGAYRDLNRRCEGMRVSAYLLDDRVATFVFDENEWLTVVAFRNEQGRSSYFFPAEWPERPSNENLGGLYETDADLEIIAHCWDQIGIGEAGKWHIGPKPCT